MTILYRWFGPGMEILVVEYRQHVVGLSKVFLSANINLCMYKIDVHFEFIYKVLYYVPSIYDRRQGGILVVH